MLKLSVDSKWLKMTYKIHVRTWGKSTVFVQESYFKKCFLEAYLESRHLEIACGCSAGIFLASFTEKKCCQEYTFTHILHVSFCCCRLTLSHEIFSLQDQTMVVEETSTALE